MTALILCCASPMWPDRPDRSCGGHLLCEMIAAYAREEAYVCVHTAHACHVIIASQARFHSCVLCVCVLVCAGKYTPDGPRPIGPRGNIYSGKIREIQPLISLLQTVGKEHNKTPAQVRWQAMRACVCVRCGLG